MSGKKIVMLGLFIGSSIGGFIPEIWGADMFSLSGLVWSFIGGIVGIWAGYRFSQYL